MQTLHQHQNDDGLPSVTFVYKNHLNRSISRLTKTESAGRVSRHAIFVFDTFLRLRAAGD